MRDIMAEVQQIDQVHDEPTITKLARIVSNIVESNIHFRMDWLLSHKWAAVPVEKGPNFNEREAEWFVAAARSINCDTCYGLENEMGVPRTICYRIPVQEDAVLEFSFEGAGMNYVVIPEDGAFAILLTSEDYNVVAGPRDFVIRALGCSIKTARTMFLNRYADDDFWLPKVREFLISVANRYEGVDG